MKDFIQKDNYAIYNNDCMNVLPSLPNNSIDFSVYSPPFADLYVYSSDERDMSNCETKEQFLQQYEYLVKQVARVTKAGRLTAVHCQDFMMNAATNDLWDFPHEIIKIHAKHGFKYKNKITIWKEPLKVRIRTMTRSLMHKTIVEDSTKAFTALPDYVLIFGKAGDNEVPVTHPHGLNVYPYFGANPISPEAYRSLNKLGKISLSAVGTDIDSYDDFYNNLVKKYKGWKDPRTNKLSHIIWQRYASSVWDDIRNENILKFRDAKEEDDERHVHALQLDVIDRLIVLYTNPNEVVLTPFMGVGSEVYSAVTLGRKAIGVELKPSYFKQATKNLATAKSRFKKREQKTLF